MIKDIEFLIEKIAIAKTASILDAKKHWENALQAAVVVLIQQEERITALENFISAEGDSLG